MRIRLITLGAGVCLLVQSLAAATGDGWTLEQLMGSLAGVQTHQTRFTETRELALLQQSLTSRGSLSFERPDRLVKTYDPPQGVRYEIDAGRLSIRRPDGQDEVIRLDNAPQLLAYVAAMRAVLAGNLERLQDYFDTRLSGDRNAWRLQLTPKSDSLARQVREIDITGSGNRIRTFLVIEQAGDRTLTRLQDSHAD